MRDDVKFLAMICPIITDTEEAAKAKHEDCLQCIDIEGIMALPGGWTGVHMSAFGDDNKLKNAESNAIQ
jgi:alkanesulfonate monooxygenase SsuD/methylene tetrahydromethanopterin reductase-like flavin-dependent oxidoreductase (luciferase family)